jgi:hypothetical protein
MNISSDPVSDPDSYLNPKPLFRFQIGSGCGQKFWILPDRDLQHCPKHCKKGTKEV